MGGQAPSPGSKQAVDALRLGSPLLARHEAGAAASTQSRPRRAQHRAPPPPAPRPPPVSQALASISKKSAWSSYTVVRLALSRSYSTSRSCAGSKQAQDESRGRVEPGRWGREARDRATLGVGPLLHSALAMLELHRVAARQTMR